MCWMNIIWINIWYSPRDSQICSKQVISQTVCSFGSIFPTIMASLKSKHSHHGLFQTRFPWSLVVRCGLIVIKSQGVHHLGSSEYMALWKRVQSFPCFVQNVYRNQKYYGKCAIYFWLLGVLSTLDEFLKLVCSVGLCCFQLPSSNWMVAMRTK